MRDILLYYLKAYYKNLLLHAADKKGSVDIVTQLLQKKLLIIAAIENDCVDIFTLFMNAGANVYHKIKDGETALMYGVNSSQKTRRGATVILIYLVVFHLFLHYGNVLEL